MDAVSGVDGSSTGVGWIDRAVGIEWMIMHELLQLHFLLPFELIVLMLYLLGHSE